MLVFSNYYYFCTYLTLLQHLFSQSVSNVVFSSCLDEAPPLKKLKVLLLVSWTNVLKSRPLTRPRPLYFAYLCRHYLNEKYCDMFIPGRKLKTTIEVF